MYFSFWTLPDSSTTACRRRRRARVAAAPPEPSDHDDGDDADDDRDGEERQALARDSYAQEGSQVESNPIQEVRTCPSAEQKHAGRAASPTATARSSSARGAFEGHYSFKSRFEDGAGTNPEELIAAAHAGCFSMALSLSHPRAATRPTRIETEATVNLRKDGDGSTIKKIDLPRRARARDRRRRAS